MVGGSPGKASHRKREREWGSLSLSRIGQDDALGLDHASGFFYVTGPMRLVAPSIG